MVVHPAPGHWNDTLVNGIMHHTKNLSSINGNIRPGIVHRIDKDTTGLLVVCKNQKSHLDIANQIKQHSVKREYVALLHGNIKEDEGEINLPIGRNLNDRKKMSVTDKNSREAITGYKVLKRYGQYTLMQLRLKTGRTHQIRVHMSYVNHPVVGDKTYGIKKEKFNLDGQLLHAKTLGFIHPTTKETVEYSSDLPDDFKRILKILED